MKYTLFLVLVVAASGLLQAQAGSTTDIIVGRVTITGGAPVPGAQVKATSAETGLSRSTTTRSTGQYTIVFPDGGGVYQVTVRRLGFSPILLTVQRRPGTDRVVADLQLNPAAVMLVGVTVRARGDTTATSAGTGRNLSPAVLNRLPIDPGDLNAVAALAPGVVGSPATDSTPTTFSVAAQPPSQNSITLDGLSLGTGLVPRDAIRSTSVITSTFDVSKGQFTGGQIASTTRGGTNHLEGSATYSVRAPGLESLGSASPAFAGASRRDQISAGLGGPIIKDRLFFFGSAQINRRADPIASLLSADPASLDRLGVSPDSAARFVQLVGATGLEALPPGFPTTSSRNDASALARIDFASMTPTSSCSVATGITVGLRAAESIRMELRRARAARTGAEGAVWRRSRPHLATS